MQINGYKAFNADKTNRYGLPFKEKTSYHIDGDIGFGNHGNGFHMCRHLSDVFRFFSDDNISVAKVVGSGRYAYGEMMDWSEPYDDMYAVSDIYIDHFMSREEIINTMLISSDSDIVKFMATFSLTDDEAFEFIRKHRGSDKVCRAFLYYCAQIKDIYHLENKDYERVLKKVYQDGQNSNKGCKGE